MSRRIDAVHRQHVDRARAPVAAVGGEGAAGFGRRGRAGDARPARPRGCRTRRAPRRRARARCRRASAGGRARAGWSRPVASAISLARLGARPVVAAGDAPDFLALGVVQHRQRQPGAAAVGDRERVLRDRATAAGGRTCAAAKNGATASAPFMSWLTVSTRTLSPSSPASSSSIGISVTHGTHQVAHRLTSTGLALEVGGGERRARRVGQLDRGHRLPGEAAVDRAGELAARSAAASGCAASALCLSHPARTRASAHVSETRDNRGMSGSNRMWGGRFAEGPERDHARD